MNLSNKIRNVAMGAGLIALAVSGTAIKPKDVNAEILRVETHELGGATLEGDVTMGKVRNQLRLDYGEIPIAYGLTFNDENDSQVVLEFYASKNGSWTRTGRDIGGNIAIISGKNFIDLPELTKTDYDKLEQKLERTEPEGVCDDYNVMLLHRYKSKSEKPRFQARFPNGDTMQVLSSKNGTFTTLNIDPGGTACLDGVGTDMEITPKKLRNYKIENQISL